MEHRWCSRWVLLGSSHHEIEREPEPNSEDWLLDFLGDLNPNMSFVQARKINKLWEETDHCDDGWYGNTRYFSHKTINLEKLHDFLYGETK